MEYKHKPERKGPSFKKIALWCLALGWLVVVGLILLNIQFEKGLTPADRVQFEARKEEQADPVKADKLFQESIKSAEAAHAKSTNLFGKIQEYGDFLHGRWRYNDAVKVFQHGADVAAAQKDASWESTFNQRLALIQYWAIQAGALDKPDPKPGLKAIELDPDSFKSPTGYAANTFLAIAEAYLGLKDYAKCDEWAHKAEDIYKKLPEHVPRKVYAVEVMSLVGQGKLRQANDIYVPRLSEFPKDDDRGTLLHAFYDAVADKNAAANEVKQKTAKLLSARDYAGLDKYAAELNADKQSMPGGTWRIEIFNGRLDNLESFADESLWKQRLSTLEEWVKQRPDSDAAKIALARVLGSYAWKARGSGYAHTVTKDGAKVFAERLKDAWQLLDQAKTRTASWYPAAQRIAMGQSWDTDRYDKIYAAARQAYPRYDATVASKVYWLQPRWFGNEGDDKVFLNGEADKVGGAEGDLLYGQVLGRLDRDRLPGILEQTDLEWARAKTGLQAQIKKDPDDMDTRVTLSSLAVQSKDLATAKAAFADIKE